VMLASNVLNRSSAASGGGLGIMSSTYFQRFGLVSSQEGATVTRRHGDGTILAFSAIVWKEKSCVAVPLFWSGSMPWQVSGSEPVGIRHEMS